MGSARAWPRAGGVRCSPGAGRRAGSSSPFQFHRSTGAPNGFGAPAASPPARTRVGHSPLPHPRTAPPLRTFGHDLDGQPNGPPTDGTDRSQVSVFRGGPQSFAAAATGNLASRNPAPATGLGSGDQSTSRGLRCQLRYAPGSSSRLARNRAGCRVTCVCSPGSPPPPHFTHPRLPVDNLPRTASALPVYPFVLAVCTRGNNAVRRASGHLARRSPSHPLSSVSSGRVRPRPLTP